MNTVSGSTCQVSGGEQAVKLTPNEVRLLGMISEHMIMTRQLIEVLHPDTRNVFVERLHARGIFLLELDDVRSVADGMSGK